MVWILGHKQELEEVLKRTAIPNPIRKVVWKVVDKTDDPKEDELVVLQDQTSWGKLGTAYQHEPYLNLSKVIITALGRNEAQAKVDKPSVDTQLSLAVDPEV